MLTNIHSRQGAEVYQDIQYDAISGFAGTAPPSVAPNSTNLIKYKTKQFDAKSILYHERTPVESIYLIRAGLVKLINYLPDGRSRIVRLNGSQNWLGLEGLLNLPYNHSAVAIGEVTVDLLPMNQFREILRFDRHLNALVTKQWHINLSQADRWIAEFSTGSIKSRVARLIHFLAGIELTQHKSEVELLTVQEMAEIVGASAESVSRTLAMFKRIELLRKCTGSLRTLYKIDLPRLEQVAAV